jgi:hypothetical protein
MVLSKVVRGRWNAIQDFSTPSFPIFIAPHFQERLKGEGGFNDLQLNWHLRACLLRDRGELCGKNQM